MKKINAIELFAHFASCWGNAWTSRFTDKAIHELALVHWQQMLNSLLSEQINTALSAAINKFDFPPSIAQFKKLALNIPSAHEAYQQAKDKRKIYRDLVGDDCYWKTCPEDKLKREFFAAYDSYVSKLLDEYNQNKNGELGYESAKLPELRA